MATIKFITVKGNGDLAREPFYVGIPQHERTISAREAYELCAEHTGYKPTAVRAVFKALAAAVRDNQALGNITYLDGVASIRNYVRGAFESLSGPWNKGVNLLVVNAVEMDPFKSLLAGIVPVNNTEGAKPAINTVFDETTLEWPTSTWRWWRRTGRRRARRSSSRTCRTSRLGWRRRCRRASTRSRSTPGAGSARSTASTWRRARSRSPNAKEERRKQLWQGMK